MTRTWDTNVETTAGVTAVPTVAVLKGMSSLVSAFGNSSIVNIVKEEDHAAIGYC